MDTTIRPANVAVLVKLEVTEGTDSAPDPALDAIPVEADSVTYNSPWTNEQSNEATGSLVAGAPLIVGQAATVSFRSRIKGAGAGQVYSVSVKPPLHAVLQSCGWRGQFTAAIATALASAGTATSVTLNATFPAVARALMGMALSITAGAGAGATPIIADYSNARVATLGDTFAPALDNTTSAALPANWTYAQTSPADAAARATDQPSATIYVYEDGTLLKFTGCRGTLSGEGQNARPGYATASFTGIYQGKTDVAMPNNLAIANHSAPVLVQGTASSRAVLLDRKPLAISRWTLDPGSQIENVEDPNTPYGFGPGQIVDRIPLLRLDPYATLVANRDSIADIGAGTRMTAVLRFGSQAGNRWSMIAPLAQKTDAAPGTRGKLRSEELTLQLLSGGKDSVTRDTDRVLCFY